MNASHSIAPSTILELMDRTFYIYRDHFVTFSALVALVAVPIGFANYAIGDTQDWLYVGLMVGKMVLQMIFVYSTITTITSENYLGRSISVIDAVRMTLKHIVLLAQVLILFVICYVVVGGALAAVAFVILPMLLYPLLIYYALASYFFIIPIMVLENVGIGLGMRRVFTLGRVRFWRVFGFWFGITVITTLISWVLLMMVSLLAGTVAANDNDAVAILLSSLVTMFLAPILPIGLTLMYYDTRIRLEGLDIALQALDKPDPRPSDLISPEPDYLWTTRQDIVNAVLLSLIPLLCGFVFFLVFMIYLINGGYNPN